MNRRTFFRRALAAVALIASPPIQIPLFASPPGGVWIRVDKWLAGLKPKPPLVLGLHPDVLKGYTEAIRRFRQFKDGRHES